MGSALQAQTAYTTPQGYTTVSLPATNSAQTTTTFVSVPLLNAPVYAGLAASVTANSIMVSGTPWTDGQWAAAGAPYFLKVLSGQQAGRFLLVTANTGNSLTVEATDHSSQTTPLNGAGFAVQTGDKIQLVAGDTLASLLGDGTAGNPVVLTSAASAFAADTVSIFNPTFNRTDVYYFNTTRGSWSQSNATTSQNNLVIYPDMALGLTRRPNRPALNFLLTGVVPEIAPLTKIVGQTAASYSSTRFPVDLPLSAINFPGWVKADTLYTADSLSIWNQALARWDIYFQLLNGQWRKSGDDTTDQSGYVVQAGTGFALFKRAAVSGPASFLAITKPYVVN